MDRSSKSQPDPVSLDACPMIFSLRDQNIYDVDEERTRRRGSEHSILPARDQKIIKILKKIHFFILSYIVVGTSRDMLAMFFMCFKGPKP